MRYIFQEINTECHFLFH